MNNRVGMGYPRLQKWIVGCALAVVAASCASSYQESQQADVLGETMESVFAKSSYSLVAASAPCANSSDFRLTLVASFVIPEAPSDPVGSVAEYWDGRGDLTERATRSRWTESEMTETIITFTQSLDGLTGEVLAYATVCSPDSIDRDTTTVTP
jgi:hypothetical protein